MDIRKPIPSNGGDWISKFGETWKSQVEKLRQKFGDSIEDVKMPSADATDVPVVYVKKTSLVELMKFVKAEPGFEYGFLSDLTAVDETPSEPRFEVVYNLFSTTRHWRLRIKVRAQDGEEVPTLTGVWAAADWAEREVWDMFGIRFAGHPDLRRILMDPRWQGHPLRKDYPLRGYQVFATPIPVEEKLLQ